MAVFPVGTGFLGGTDVASPTVFSGLQFCRVFQLCVSDRSEFLPTPLRRRCMAECEKPEINPRQRAV